MTFPYRDDTPSHPPVTARAGERISPVELRAALECDRSSFVWATRTLVAFHDAPLDVLTLRVRIPPATPGWPRRYRLAVIAPSTFVLSATVDGSPTLMIVGAGSGVVVTDTRDLDPASDGEQTLTISALSQSGEQLVTGYVAEITAIREV